MERYYTPEFLYACTPDGQQTWRFLCLINRHPIYLLSGHIDHTWDYITERAYGDHVK